MNKLYEEQAPDRLTRFDVEETLSKVRGMIVALHEEAMFCRLNPEEHTFHNEPATMRRHARETIDCAARLNALTVAWQLAAEAQEESRRKRT